LDDADKLKRMKEELVTIANKLYFIAGELEKMRQNV
jgi:hypothetical protein